MKKNEPVASLTHLRQCDDESYSFVESYVFVKRLVTRISLLLGQRRVGGSFAFL